jgi:transposase
VIWGVVERLDLSAFYDPIVARGSNPGRSATDPRLLISLWLYATKNGVGSGRELERLCGCHDAYRWLCGGISVNYHTLNDFRTGYGQQIDDLLTKVLTSLVHKGIVSVERTSQDGTRVRASAGSSSFHRRETLERLQGEMNEHVLALKKRLEDPASGTTPTRQRAAQQRAARERSERVEQALQALDEIEAAKARQKAKASKGRAARASTTDPQARVMKMPGGGYAPGYNIQFAADTKSRAIVGVAVTNAGSDVNESEPMRKQVERRSGQKVKEHLVDGGYIGLENIECAAQDKVTMYAPVPKPRKKGVNKYAARRGDSPAIGEWRQRMGTKAAQKIYLQRASTSETINGDLKTWRGLATVCVRGIEKVKCIALWGALTYNIMHFGSFL